MTDESPVVPKPPPSEPLWAKTVISIVVLVLYGIAHYIAWTTKVGLDAMLGSDGTLAAAVVYYWVGSSAGSDRKTAIISRIPPTQ